MFLVCLSLSESFSGQHSYSYGVEALRSLSVFFFVDNPAPLLGLTCGDCLAALGLSVGIRVVCFSGLGKGL